MTSRGGDRVLIGSHETINDDLYVSGNTVAIDGTVKGDVIAAGRQITINGTIEGDLMAVGQAVVINGNVNDDVRVAGQAIQLGSRARIGDDAIAAGFSLESQPDSRVGGSLFFAGVQALLAGTIEQNVTGGMTALELRGAVGKNVKVTVSPERGETRPFYPPFLPQPPIPTPQLREGLALADAARIGGKLIYQSPTEGEMSPAAQVAEGQVREPIERRPHSPTFGTLRHLQRFVTLLIVGLLLLWVVPAWTQNLANTVWFEPLPSLGWGLLTCLAVGILAIAIPSLTLILTAILGLTIGGLVPLLLGLGLLAFFTLVISFLLFVSYVPQIVLSFLGGQWLLRVLRSSGASRRITPLVVGLLLFVLLTAIPILGGLINLLAILLGLGALGIGGQTKFMKSLLPTPYL